jgi:hypothetical protein
MTEEESDRKLLTYLRNAVEKAASDTLLASERFGGLKFLREQLEEKIANGYDAPAKKPAQKGKKK